VQKEESVSQQVLIAANFVAIAVLVFGIYFPRHRRRDMIVAYLGINAGVLAIAAILTSVNATVGLGLGLFGMLSIIRLRSVELDQQEVAYYFASLALGLLGGIRLDSYGVALFAMGALLVAIWFGDHPRLLARYRSQTMTLDRAFVDEQAVSAFLAEVLGAQVHGVVIRRTDFVYDSTVVDVRFRVPRSVPAGGRGLTAVPLSTRSAA
jgi:hypothetical protein